MTAPAPARPRLTRVTEGRALGGVAAGVAEHLGLPPLVIRGAFLVLALFGGVGIAMYAALWVVTPQAEGARQVDGADRVQLLALAALGLGGFLLLQGMGLLSPALLPLLVVGGGVALVWQQADEVQRARWRSARGRGPLIVVAGAVLVAGGLIGFAATRGELQAAREGLLFTGLAVLGLVLLSAPWWVRLSSDLRHERRERIRSQERAEVAAHVHDSVLQTLALIRKAADDPREVQRLVRTSERELRGWLYRPTSTAETAFAGALEQAAAEVEEAHGVTVEVVVVGDCPTSPPLLALVAAAREALVNAARHAGVDTVRAFAEVMPDRVEVFVRDRGCGFDPDAVPADRYGIAQSVIGRMERNGGTAVVRSSPGEGTEVRLEVARS
ncbi:MAG: ATP-binding protein [Frankiales bacterium]|nr:MAG: ATP-binding protein [Frankiales bacterium]